MGLDAARVLRRHLELRRPGEHGGRGESRQDTHPWGGHLPYNSYTRPHGMTGALPQAAAASRHWVRCGSESPSIRAESEVCSTQQKEADYEPA